jgi:uncharacterized DUF497 family protein
MAEEFDKLFAAIRRFGWDPAKREIVLNERGIVFDEVHLVFNGPTVAYRSDRNGEERYVVFGFLFDVEVAIVCTLSGRPMLDHIRPASEQK